MLLSRLHTRSLRSHAAISWRRLSGVVVLALLVAIAPGAVELCGATCAMAHQHVMPAASAHCAGHAAAGRTLMSAHPCGMDTHGELGQLAATPAMTTQAKPLAPPTQLQTAVLPLSAARAFSRSPLIAIHSERSDLHAARSRPLTLALRI